MRKVYITTEQIKLAAFLKFCGAADSGGKANGFIADGATMVNGEICRHRGKKLQAGDKVELDGQQYEVKNACI